MALGGHTYRRNVAMNMMVRATVAVVPERRSLVRERGIIVRAQIRFAEAILDKRRDKICRALDALISAAERYSYDDLGVSLAALHGHVSFRKRNPGAKDRRRELRRKKWDTTANDIGSWDKLTMGIWQDIILGGYTTEDILRRTGRSLAKFLKIALPLSPEEVLRRIQENRRRAA